MTQRFFYTDPLAAAWMAKHFGMKIHGPVINALGKLGTSRRPMQVWILARTIENTEKGHMPADARYYIGSASLHLLEPQVGDIYTYRDDKRFVHLHQVHDAFDLNCEQGKVLTPQNCYTGTTIECIIQRNGIAFMWPESEGA